MIINAGALLQGPLRPILILVLLGCRGEAHALEHGHGLAGF